MAWPICRIGKIAIVRSLTKRERWLAFSLSMLVTALYVSLAVAHGALGASRNDDWTYYRIAFALHQQREFLPDPYTRTMLLGQIVAAQPVILVFGESISALQIFVALLGAVGLFAAYVFLRGFLSPAWATFSVATLAIGPIYGSLSVSFMSDVPAFALQALALLAGQRAVRARDHDVQWLTASLALSFIGFTVREYALVSAITVVVAYVLIRRTEPRRVLSALALGVAWLVAAALLYYWRNHLPSLGPGSSITPASIRSVIVTTIRLGYTIAALVLPAALLLWWPARPAVSKRITALLAGLLVAVALELKLGGRLLLGNYFTPYGSYPDTLVGPAARTEPPMVWTGITVLAWLAAGAIAFTTLRGAYFTIRRQRSLASLSHGYLLAVVFVATTLVVTAASSALTAGWIADRYVVACVPYLAGVLVHQVKDTVTSRALTVVATVLLGAWGVLGLNQVDNSATLEGAKNRMGELLVARGYDPSTVDAGLEWFGMHQQSPVTRPTPDPGNYAFWLGLVEHPRTCVLAHSPNLDTSAQPAVVARITERSLLGVRYDILANDVDVNCPTGPVRR